MASDCAHNFCAQGVCCATACTGTCASCALAGTMGTCTSVPAGQDPLNQCTDQGVATCGTDGSCNGSGACRKYASGTTCVAADLHGNDAHAGRDVQHEQRVRHAGERVVRAVRLRHRRLQDHLHDEHRLRRRALRLHRHDLHAPTRC